MITSLKSIFMSTTKVLLGFVAGAAVGTLAGLLFAPDSGANTRKKMTDKAGDLTDSAKETFNGLMDGVKNAYSTTKDRVEDFGARTQDKMEELGAHTKAKMTTARNEVKDEVRTAKTDIKSALS